MVVCWIARSNFCLQCSLENDRFPFVVCFTLTMKSFQPIYSLLMLATVVCVVVASSAVHVLLGQGRDVLLVGIGTIIGMCLRSSIGLRSWLAFIDSVDLLFEQTTSENMISAKIGAITLYLPGQEESIRQFISPKIAMRLATPTVSKEFTLETEVRSLLDAVDRLGQAVVIDGFCHCCQHQDEHSADCDYIRSMQLHEDGCSKRVAWSEFRQQLEHYG